MEQVILPEYGCVTLPKKVFTQIIIWWQETQLKHNNKHGNIKLRMQRRLKRESRTFSKRTVAGR